LSNQLPKLRFDIGALIISSSLRTNLLEQDKAEVIQTSGRRNRRAAMPLRVGGFKGPTITDHGGNKGTRGQGDAEAAAALFSCPGLALALALARPSSSKRQASKQASRQASTQSQPKPKPKPSSAHHPRFAAQVVTCLQLTSTAPLLAAERERKRETELHLRLHLSPTLVSFALLHTLTVVRLLCPRLLNGHIALALLLVQIPRISSPTPAACCFFSITITTHC
jgi:hypothetical protein